MTHLLSWLSPSETERTYTDKRMKYSTTLLAVLMAAGATCAGLEEVDILVCPARNDAAPFLKEFVWPEQQVQLSNCVAQVSAPYSVTVGLLTNGWMENAGEIRFSVGNALRLSVTGHSQTVFAHASNVLYVANFCPIASDCSISAFDLQNSKQLWQTYLHGLLFVAHSIYSNRVQLDLTPTLVVIRGREGGGDYAECLDRTTGQIVGHRIFSHWDPETLKGVKESPTRCLDPYPGKPRFARLSKSGQARRFV